MEINIETEGSIRVAHLTGDFGPGEECDLASELHPLVAERSSRLAIDLSGLEHINSIGLAELINTVIRARLSGSRVVLVSPSAFVCGVFEVTRLDKWFEIVDDISAARASLEQ